MDIQTIFTPELVANIFLTIFAALLTGIMTFVLKFVRGKVSDQQFALLQDVAGEAVRYAEQGKAAGLINDKKAAALAAASAALKKAGAGVEPDVLEMAIEAAVLRAFNPDLGVDYPTFAPVPEMTPEPVDEPEIPAE